MAEQIRDKCVKTWSLGIINLIHAFDPEKIVIGGGIMESHHVLLTANPTHDHYPLMGKKQSSGTVGRNASANGRNLRNVPFINREQERSQNDTMKSNFDKHPSIRVSHNNEDCIVGWNNIAGKINDVVRAKGKSRVVVAIDCYQGVLHDEVETALQKELHYGLLVKSSAAFKTPEAKQQQWFTPM